MQPNQPQTTDSNQIVQPSPAPVGQQPTPSSTITGGLKPATAENIKKQKLIALLMGTASIVIFAIGLVFDFVLAGAAALGAYALYVGIRQKAVYLGVIGAIGLGLNGIFYILAVIFS